MASLVKLGTSIRRQSNGFNNLETVLSSDSSIQIDLPVVLRQTASSLFDLSFSCCAKPNAAGSVSDCCCRAFDCKKGANQVSKAFFKSG